MGFLGPLLGGLLGGLGSGIAGALNPRPPSLDPTQKHALDTLIPNLLGRAQGTPTIDPIQQALMYGNIATSRTGADNALTHALVSRGLGRSGLLGAGLIQNQNAATQAQNASNLGLQQQAIQQQNFAIQSLAQLLNVGSTPGQSGAGAFSAGLAPILAYSLANMQFGGGGGMGPGVFGNNPFGGGPGGSFGGSLGLPAGGLPTTIPGVMT